MLDTHLLVEELEVRTALVPRVVLGLRLLRARLLWNLLRLLRFPRGVLVRPLVVRAVVVVAGVVLVFVLERLLTVYTVLATDSMDLSKHATHSSQP